MILIEDTAGIERDQPVAGKQPRRREPRQFSGLRVFVLKKAEVVRNALDGTALAEKTARHPCLYP
jgi:hypothetical protein